MTAKFPDDFKTVRIFQMTANFPDYFKIVRIFRMVADFPDDFKSVRIFQIGSLKLLIGVKDLDLGENQGV